MRPAGTDPVVFTLWHGQMLPILYAHGMRCGILISEHRDGEIIARIVEMFGHFAVRGSSSRGGTRALLEAVKQVREGTDMVFTPDGPRGPLHSYAPGPLISRTGTGAHRDHHRARRSLLASEIVGPFRDSQTVRAGDGVVR